MIQSGLITILRTEMSESVKKNVFSFLLGLALFVGLL